MDTYLSKMRDWKNRNFKDWLWDLLVGAGCGVVGLLGLLIDAEWLVVAVPLVVTVVNQLYNKLFEPKDAVLRMVVPVVMYIIIILKILFTSAIV